MIAGAPCDFKTGQAIRRMGGMNLKGVLTRDRRPKHRDLVKGLRFFFGRLQPLENWGTELAKAFATDLGPNY